MPSIAAALPIRAAIFGSFHCFICPFITTQKYPLFKVVKEYAAPQCLHISQASTIALCRHDEERRFAAKLS